MTVVNPKSISGINSITTGSGSDDLLTIHTNNGTERLRIDSTGATKIVTGIVTTLTATTGIVTTLTANTVTSLGAVSGTTGTFSGAVSGTTGTFSGAISGTTGTFTSHVSLGDSDQLRLGDSNDLVLQHNGTDSIIADTGTGDLYIRGSNDIFLQKGDGSETFMSATDDAGINLYHNNVNKFSTQAYGIAVDGVVTFTKDAADDTTSTLQINGAAMTSDDYNYIMSATNNSANCLTMFINGSTRGSDGGNNGLTIRNDNGPMSVGLNGTTHSNFFYTGAAGGVDFSGHGNTGGMTSELLDDYEEGTFTPAVNGGTTNTQTFDSTGRYTKIGRMVYCQFLLQYSGAGTGAHLGYSGLPFTGANNTSRGGGTVLWTNIPGLNDFDAISAIVEQNATTLKCYYSMDNNAFTGSGGFTNKAIYIRITYEAA